MIQKKIAKIEVIKAGSNPDIDSDFNTICRDSVIEMITEKYGKENTANIITFNTLAAKGAFKAMCTIYEVPFAQANKITSLIPPDVEGEPCTIEDIYNPNSDRYSEAADFRTATSDDFWKPIIAGAKEISGRNKSVGVHPCGMVISSKKLAEVIPLHVRQKDGRVITQLSYKDLEELGLIKMDILGLDTVDLIQKTIEYIQKSGKEAPNMLDIIHGKMDDKKTYKMISRGDTIGVFQLAGSGVQDLLKRIRPTNINDIVATTALYRPGPMGMQSHIKYADRKNGVEKVESIHKDFEGSPLDEILKDTFGLIVYQEQILKISNEIAGMTLQEGDDLRSAMGKKIIPKMNAMKPKFINGGIKNGYSEEAMKILWETCETFAKYGFNKSHSVAYGMTAYQSAYLKANYPVEFMSALISQHTNNKDKTLTHLQEAKRMGLKIGTVDINNSDIKVSPNFSNNGEYDIVYGLSGVMGVSDEMAEIIVKERENNGLYKNVQDVFNRCVPLGVNNRRIYENLALAGAFDNMNTTRKGVVDNLLGLITEAKNKSVKGANLFDMFSSNTDNMGIDLSKTVEYPFVDKLKHEANVIGLYITEHPLSRVGPGLSKMSNTNIKTLLTSKNSQTINIVGSITEITKKMRRNGAKTVMISIDDGTGYLTAILNRDVVKGIDKKIAQEKLKTLYEAGERVIPKEIRALVNDDKITALKDLEKNSVYVMNLTFRPAFNENSQYGARINSIRPLQLAEDGSLPIRIRYENFSEKNDKHQRIKKSLPASLAKKIPGTYPIFTAEYKRIALNDNDHIYKSALIKIDKEAALTSDEKSRSWPPPSLSKNTNQISKTDINNTVKFIETLEYTDTGYKADKTQQLEELIERFVGVEGYDFGIFNPEVLE